MVVAAPGDTGSAQLVPQADEHPQQDLLAVIDPDQRQLAAPGAPQYNAAMVDLDSAVYEVVLPYAAANGGKHRSGAHRGAAGASGARAGGGTPEGALMMGLLDSPNATALEARLNEARRIRRGRDLRRERRLFLSRLTHEREERVHLEAWAATRVQAIFRGFLARPRPPRPHPRQKLTPAESNRRLVADLQAILARAGLPTIPGLGPDGRKASGGTTWGVGRGSNHGAPTAAGASGGGCGGRGGGLRRSRSRRQRMFEDEMSTRITKLVRGFLERRRFGRRWTVWNRKRRWSGACRIQHAWRAYRKRMGWRELESEVMGLAATRIQARWRGMACRMALARRATEDALDKRRTVSAVTIQTAARRRAAIAKHGPRLTLGVARRKREARAAAEASRPRRRWNRGAPATAGPGSATAAAPPQAGAGTGPAAGGGGGGVNGAAKTAVTPSQRVASTKGGGTASSSSTSSLSMASSSHRKKLETRDTAEKEPAHAWEQGPPNPNAEAGGVSEGGGGGDSRDSALTGSSERKADGDGPRRSLSESNASDEGRGDERSHGGALSAGSKRASQEATSLFVRESIRAAVSKAGARVSTVGEDLGAGVDFAASDGAGDFAATKVSTEAAVAAAAAAAAAADGDPRIDRVGVPTAVAGSASKPAA
eukprot:g7940.t1